MRKKGDMAAAPPSPSAAVTFAMPSAISAFARSIDRRCMPDGWLWVWVATVWPASRTLRTPSGLACAWRPTMKNVAFTHCAARMSRIWLLCFGSGPSSKVSTTSPSLSGNVSRYCIVPISGCALASTTSVRDVPSASGRGQLAANPAGAESKTASPKHNAATRRTPTPNLLLPVITAARIPTT